MTDNPIFNLIERPSGRCNCRMCNKKITYNQIEVTGNVYRGHTQYYKFCEECFLKEVVRNFPTLNEEKLNQIKKEIIVENL